MQLHYSKAQLTALLLEHQITNWPDAVQFVSSLPYGRNLNRNDLSLIILEGKGTCSSKHAFLKQVAEENQIEGVKLILAICKMNRHNTVEIEALLENSKLDYIPEAHCFLKINENITDLTFPNPELNHLSDFIITELEIAPKDVADFKITYHMNFIKNWIMECNIPYSFKQIWTIRELCIQLLTQNRTKT